MTCLSTESPCDMDLSMTRTNKQLDSVETTSKIVINDQMPV